MQRVMIPSMGIVPVAWALVGILVWIGRCAQLLGLGDYGAAQDAASSNPSSEGSVDASAVDEAATPWVDAGSDAPFQDALDGSIPEAVGAVDVTIGSLQDATSGGESAGDTYGSETQTSDTSLDAGASDAATDSGAACPTACNSGCGDGGTCLITITSSATGSVDCPPGLACQVHCLGTQVCGTSINCAPGQPCRVTCEGSEACIGNTINQGGATSLCVECLAAGKNGSCNSVNCSATACFFLCGVKCGGSCGNCTPVSSCP